MSYDNDKVTFTPCPLCEGGMLVPVTGFSRRVIWKIGTKQVPDGMFVRTCSKCSYVLLDDEEMEYLASVWAS